MATFDEGKKESGSAAGESGDKAPQSKWSEDFVLNSFQLVGQVPTCPIPAG